MNKNHSCLTWKSSRTSFNKAIEKLNLNFKIVDKCISDKHIERFTKYEYQPEKVQSQLMNLVVYDIEAFSTAVFYSICLYKLGKNSSKYDRDITQREYENFRNDCIVFKGTNCFNEILDNVSETKSQPKNYRNCYIICILSSS